MCLPDPLFCYSVSDVTSPPALCSPPESPMITATPLNDYLALEKLRERGLEEARIIQNAMLPSLPLHIDNVVVSHELQPVMEAGGD
jgi:hypothetical protein